MTDICLYFIGYFIISLVDVVGENRSFDIIFKNIIETSSNPTGFGHFKEIVLDAQTKRFIILKTSVVDLKLMDFCSKFRR